MAPRLFRRIMLLAVLTRPAVQSFTTFYRVLDAADGVFFFFFFFRWRDPLHPVTSICRKNPADYASEFDPKIDFLPTGAAASSQSVF